jgi:ATP-dependent DNA helicase Q1
MDEILELSRSEFQSIQPQSPQKPGPSRITHSVPHHRTQQALNEQISQIDAEICGFDQDIKELNALRALRVAEKDALLEKLRLIQNRGHEGKGKRKMPQGGIDYFLEDFDWSEELKVRMKKVFGINSFRLCQQGLVPVGAQQCSFFDLTCRVCNANMDARDIICVMPTGTSILPCASILLSRQRWWKVLDVSVARSHDTRMHFGDLPANISDHRSGFAPQRCRKSGFIPFTISL